MFSCWPKAWQDGAIRLAGWVEQHAFCLAAAVSMLCLVGMACLSTRTITSDVDNIGGVEPYVVYTVQKIFSGAPVYTPADRPPFDFTQYSPGYYWLVAAVARMVSPDGVDVPITYIVARAVSTSCSALLLVAMAFLARRLSISPSLIIILCSMTALAQFPFSCLGRPDALASLMMILSLYCMVRDSERPRNMPSRGWLAAACTLGLFSMLSKQNGVQVLLLIFSYYFLVRDFRRLAIMGAVTLIIGGATALGLWYAFGLAFKQNAIDGLRNGVHLGDLFGKVFPGFFLWRGGAVLTASLSVFLVTAMRPEAPRPHKLLAYTGGFTLIFATGIALKYGSSYNYYNDYFVVAGLAGASVLGFRGGGKGAGQGKGHSHLAVAVFIVLWLPILLYSHFTAPAQYEGARVSGRAGIAQTVRTLVEEDPDMRFFTTDTVLACHFPGHVVVPHHFLSCIAHTCGARDHAPLQAYLREGHVTYCIVGAEQKPARQLGFLGVDADFFTRQWCEDGYSIWKLDPAKVAGK